MLHFEKVSRFNDEEITMPMRKTSNSAGYDFAVAEDTVIPPMDEQMGKLMHCAMNKENIHIGDVITLEEFAEMTKATKAKPTLVSTGV
jgi:dUTPase